MNTGVSMTPWFSVSRPRRARASVPRTSNFNIGTLSPRQTKRAARWCGAARRFVRRATEARGTRLRSGAAAAVLRLPAGRRLRSSAAVADHQLVGLAPLGQFGLDVGAGAAGIRRLRHDGGGGRFSAFTDGLEFAGGLHVAGLRDHRLAGALLVRL